jgi:hypothetical protein
MVVKTLHRRAKRFVKRRPLKQAGRPVAASATRKLFDKPRFCPILKTFWRLFATQ